MRGSGRRDTRVVGGLVALSAALGVALGYDQGCAWAAAVAREAAIDWNTTGGVKGLGEAIDTLLALGFTAIGGLVLAIPAAASIAMSHLPRRRTVFGAVIGTVTVALAAGLAVGSGIDDPGGFVARRLLSGSLLLLTAVTVGALIGFGAGSLMRRDDHPRTSAGPTHRAASSR